MTPENPDHYKYMPRRPGEEPEQPEASPEPLATEAPLQQEAPAEAPQEAADAVAAPETEPTDEGRETDRSLWSTALKAFLQPFYWVLNPFLAATYASLLIFLLSVLAITAPGAATPYTLTVFGATCLFPVVAIMVLKAVGAIHSSTLRSRRDRVFPYVLELVGMSAVTLFFAYKGAPQWLIDVFIGATVTVALNFVINFRWRISCHCSAAAALTGVFFAINRDGLPHEALGWWVMGAAIAAGIAGSGAILIGNHRLRDVLLGYLTGFLPVILFGLIR